MLKVKDINVSYKDVQVLWDVSFEVKEGEFVAILGANGAGKTTTLNAISGLLKVGKGSIEFMGKDITQIPGYKVAELGIIHVPEGRRLFPEMTVRENLEMGSLFPEAKSKRKETMKKVFEHFPILEEKQHKEAGTLSGGQQQMLALGRGLMALPKLLILDEPSLGLAPVLVKQIFENIRDINNEGVTVLQVEQNVVQTLNMCHRAYVLENGKVFIQGTGQELLNNEHIKEAYLGI
ncbi:ABC transporter ATP-binding protein [Pelotomaculum propionicicum]|uniref:High-affinity branched-chain amino acid transport ATP-binding protein LivF n=1 Tax=Pelotomaculum propionicicum TaxID=258475 RepID=A0A4Y7RQP1_9FIRM|nr:ABC transporter ATP-binding protein [Pelotomaculum propionicicum]NLI13652.1 ABC transporter ATP-binding protein [Peptococcaceae bacterium]TEB11328.1 High-affinity branched-chain amino acid transport ATP-binding protein LivF [Pelotomaculum propionicicum]